MRRGRRLGVDAGEARVGLAACDPEGILASPVRTLARSGLEDGDVARQIAAEAREAGVIEIVVGLPAHLSGARGAAALKAEALAAAIAEASGKPVRLVDERLTTVEAAGALRRAGRSARAQRAVIDQVSAVVILQHALDAERAGGAPPGRAVTLESGGQSQPRGITRD
jgi:putative Holliday junction resolvase